MGWEDHSFGIALAEAGEFGGVALAGGCGVLGVEFEFAGEVEGNRGRRTARSPSQRSIVLLASECFPRFVYPIINILFHKIYS